MNAILVPTIWLLLVAQEPVQPSDPAQSFEKRILPVIQLAEKTPREPQGRLDCSFNQLNVYQCEE
jgi:hypothetical protein